MYARLTLDLGPESVASLAHEMGVRSPLESVPSIGLGSNDVSVLDMASAYATLASGGVYSRPRAIREVVLPNGEVDTGSGWMSDRTVQYLASGKPCLVQDTGFSRNYPAGEGLVPFQTLDEAVAGAEAIARDYERHAAAARELAAGCFDSDAVLPVLLGQAGLSI